uniref:uncharacterized protein LOC120339377 n=1 Tax=Styela clava TaxID=7725 RepID=UPI00193A47D1|nr:uncharacterized protein LOC120339377 [Styela clava]
MESHSDTDVATAKRLAQMFLADTENKLPRSSSKAEIYSDKPEKPSVDTIGKNLAKDPVTRRKSFAGELPGYTPQKNSTMPPMEGMAYSFHQATLNLTSQEFNLERIKDRGGIQKVPDSRERPNIQFNMDTIVRQIRDDIIDRCRKICEKAALMKYDERQEAGLIPDELRADLEKRLADLIIVGERSGLGKHTLCVYELECHFHIKIAMVHIEGPTESIDKAVQLYRMGQFAEALPMLELQLEKTNCYMHELVAGCLFNLGRIEEAGFHFQQAISNMTNRDISDRTVKTEKQQSNLLATAKNAKAKAGESMKNHQFEDAIRYYYMSNVLFSGIENRQEGIDGMILCMGGLNDVIQALMKVDPVEGGSPTTRDALTSLLEMHDLFNDIITNCDVDVGYRDHCKALCMNVVGLAFECTGRYMSALNRYKEAQNCYSRITDDRQKLLRMRDCILKARHSVRSLAKQVGGAYSDGEIPSQVRQAMSIVLQMHSSFMSISERVHVDPEFRAENQAEVLNSVGIGYYELRQFEQAEAMLKAGIDLLKKKIGPECRIITLAQLTYNIGLLYQDIGQLPKAKACYQEARILYQKIDDEQTRDEGMRKAEEALDDIE